MMLTHKLLALGAVRVLSLSAIAPVASMASAKPAAEPKTLKVQSPKVRVNHGTLQ